MKTIKKVALAIFKDKKMLQVRSKNQKEVFFTLGGKPEAGESEIEALKREVMEEIGCEIDETTIKFLTEFEDVAHGGGMVAIKVFAGKLIGEPKPSSEIAEIGWFDTNSDKKHITTIAARTIFPWLKRHGYIN